MTPEGVAQLRRHEGERIEHGVHVPYRDSQGYLTIGYGHNLDAKGVTQRVADLILEDDIRDAEIIVRVRFPWVSALNDARKDAFVNLVHNLGGRGLAGFKKFLSACQDGKWDTAKAELLDSEYAKQVGVRAQELAEQIRTGEHRP